MKSSKSNKELEFVCENCGEIFHKTEKDICKNKGVLPKFCSIKCAAEYRSKTHNIIVECKQCGKQFSVNKSHINPDGNFCSRSCAATYNNSHRSQNVYNKQAETLIKHYNVNTECVEYEGKVINKNKICPKCGGLKSPQSKLCRKCNLEKAHKNVSDLSLGYYIDGKKYLSNKLSVVRQNARMVLEKSDVEKVCAYCHNHEFDSILEVHHIKGILKFSSDTKISEINGLDNLIWLCPNHHTMLERGLITLPKS